MCLTVRVRQCSISNIGRPRRDRRREKEGKSEGQTEGKTFSGRATTFLVGVFREDDSRRSRRYDANISLTYIKHQFERGRRCVGGAHVRKKLFVTSRHGRIRTRVRDTVSIRTRKNVQRTFRSFRHPGTVFKSFRRCPCTDAF